MNIILMNIIFMLAMITWILSVTMLLIFSAKKDSMGLKVPNKWVVITIYLMSFIIILFVIAKGNMWYSTKYFETKTKTIVNIVNDKITKSDTLIRIERIK